MRELREPIPITESKLLIVEGHTAEVFFRAFLTEVGLADMQIQDFGGINDLPSFLRALRITSGFAGVTSLGIIRDAENDPTAAFQSVCSALGNAQFDVPGQPEAFAGTRPQVGVLILPDAMTPGMLETLCLRSVAGDRAMPCVEEYFECIGRRVAEEEMPKNMDKAKVQAFLASRLDPEMHLGRAAQKRYWPWDSPVFDHVRQFLSDL